jgi:hypothetical protein
MILRLIYTTTVKTRSSEVLKRVSGSIGVVLLVSFLTSCAIPHPPLPHDANNPLKRVAVLPMKNDTNDVDGPEMMRKKMIEALERRSYVVKDVKETDQILRDRMGITLGGQLDMTTAQKIGETLGVEGLLYGTLMDFDELTTGAINVKKVRGKFKLVNTATGQPVWARALGIRSEMRMEGNAGAAAALASRAVDARDKEAPWITIESTSTGSKKLGESFAVGLGTRLVSKAFGVHLEHESTELARRITESLPWGPGGTTGPSAPVIKIAAPEVKMPAAPSFGYMDWEGKRDFTTIVFSTTIDKARNETRVMEMPLAIAGNKMRMDMDLSKMMKGDAQSPFSKMIVISRGDKQAGYTLYPNTQKYVVNKEKEATDEKPRVEKAKVGSEVVLKHPTDKYKVRIIYKDGKVEEGFIWNANDLSGMTIKSEVENKDYRVTTELRNVVLKTPPASTFEIPAGYVEAQNFMEIMTTEPTKK